MTSVYKRGLEKKSLNGHITRPWHRLEVKPKSPCADHGKMARATKLHCMFYTPPFWSPWNQQFHPAMGGQFVVFLQIPEASSSGCSECQYFESSRLCSLNFSGIPSSSPLWEASQSALHPKWRVKEGGAGSLLTTRLPSQPFI